jgi:hypothetical protein
MTIYLRVLGSLLCVLGIAGSLWCGYQAFHNEAYYKAVKGSELYPNNVLYTTELKIAEPRHMLLLAGAAASAPVGLILGSICLGIATTIRRLDDWQL